MLVELRIRDYAVVEDLTLELGPGLNALTGETGAGKSIIVGALSLLLGERASSTVVRAGAARASVEAVFDIRGHEAIGAILEERGLTVEEDLLILRRQVAAEGRNRAWVNGSPATAGIVGALGTALVDLHGQHEHQTLLRPRDQRRILDAFAGGTDAAARVADRYQAVHELTRALDDHEERMREIASRSDFLNYQLNEIDAARLEPAEDSALESEARRHEHAEELAAGAAAVYDALYGADGSISDRLAAVRQELERVVSIDPSLAEELELLTEAFHAISDVGRRVGDYAGTVPHDPVRLEEVRSRLDLIFRLKRKYGPELADVLATAQRVREEVEALEEADHDLEALRSRLGAEAGRLEEAAAELTALRRRAAEQLSDAVSEVLPDLGLPGARFEVRLTPHVQVGAGGAEAVEFLVAPNPGFEPMPLARVASGGELSRVMLALKSILADVDAVPVLVFDEIDAGIGGVVASAVAAKLADVARDHQVFVVTHLAQVASRADGHLRVEKEIESGVTAASVTRLHGEARVQEIARMLGGDPDSDASKLHARELLGA